MKTTERKQAIADYKKREAVAGIYAVRCLATGETWVGQAPNLDGVENRTRFSLRMGSHVNKALQQAWSIQGSEAFSFEILERLPEEELGFVRDRLLKERLAHWRSSLAAASI